MADERDLRTPVSKEEERRQAELRRDFEAREERTEELKLQILSQRGPEFEKAAEIKGESDPHAKKAIAEAAAGILAMRETQPGRVFYHDERSLIDEATAQISAREELAQQQELAADKAQLHQLPREADAAELKTDWHKTAHEILDRKAPPPPGKGTSQPAPQPPQPPPLNQQLQLTANEVVQRFSDPLLQARYLEQEQRRDQEKKSSLPIPGTSPSMAARGNVPVEKAHESDLMSHFKTSEIKKKAAEEEERRSNDPTKGLGRSGGRGR